MTRIAAIGALAGFVGWAAAAQADRVTRGPVIVSTDVVRAPCPGTAVRVT